MRRSHGGTRDGVDGVLASGPGRLDTLTRGKDVVTLAEIGEVSPLVGQVASTN